MDRRLSGRSSSQRDLSGMKNEAPLLAPGITKQQRQSQQRSHPSPVAPLLPQFDSLRLTPGITKSYQQQAPQQRPPFFGMPMAVPASQPSFLLPDPVPRNNYSSMRPPSTGPQPAFPYMPRDLLNYLAVEPLMDGAGVNNVPKSRGGANSRRGYRVRPNYRPARSRDVPTSAPTNEDRPDSSSSRSSYHRGPNYFPEKKRFRQRSRKPLVNSSSNDGSKVNSTLGEGGQFGSPAELSRRRHSSGDSVDGQSNYSEANYSETGQYDEDPFSASIPDPDDMVIDPTALELTGLPSNVDVKCLCYYLEVATNFTAEVVSVLFRSNRQSAVVYFNQDINLENVRNFCSEVPLDDDQLLIDVSELAEASAIQIAGLKKPWTEDYVKLIVENYILKASISTAISKVVMAEDIAVVALTSSSGCQSLVEAMRQEPQHYRSVAPFYKSLGITMEADMIDCTSGRLPSVKTTKDNPRQPTLFIGGFSKGPASETHVRLFFKSNSRSGGEDCIEELLVDDKMVILRYASESVADRVIDKIAKQDLKFENDSLWVAVGWHRQHTLMDGSVFILRNLPETVSRVALLYFLWAKACCRVFSVCFSLRRNVALVEFDQGVNFKSLFSAIAEGEFFRGVGGAGSDPNTAARPIELLQIPPVTCLQFSGVPESGSEQYVELLVDDVCKCHAEVEAHMDSGACALRLPNQQEAFKVRFTDLELEGASLRVTPYHSMTGLTAEDEMSVTWLLPAPLALDFVEGPVLTHIVSSPAVRRALEEKLGSAHACLVEPPDAASASDGRMSQAKASTVGWSIKCLVADVAAASKESVATLRGQWKASVMRMIEAFCADFTYDSIEVEASIWPQVKPVIATTASGIGGSEAIRLISEEDTDDGVHRFVVVGRREAVQAVQAAVDLAVQQATESGRRASDESVVPRVSDTRRGSNAAAARGCSSFDVRRRELLYLQFRQVSKWLKADVNASVVITLQPSGRVSISGPDDTLLPAAAYVRALLGRLVHRDVPLPTAAVQLMVKREGYQHMVASLKAIGVAAFWEPAGDVGITLCAEDGDNLEKAIGVVQAQLKTFDVKASDGERSKAALSSPEFVSSVAELRHQWQKQAVVIQLSADGLSAAAVLPLARAISDLSRLWDSVAGQTRPVIHVDDIVAFNLLRFHLRALLGGRGMYISFEEKDGGGSGDVIVSAPATLVSAICDDVHSVLSRIHRTWLPVFGDARVNWLTSPAGRNFLSTSSHQGHTYARYFKTERLATRLRPDGRRLLIVRGCALLQSGQCLLIGSNPKLDLAASLTGQQLLAIDGQTIQNQCNEIVKNRKTIELQEGNCFITHASKWPYNAVVHVVCPTYQDDPLAASDDLLVFALIKGFEAISNKKYSSVVLPSIGSDGFGFPPEVGAEQLVKAMNMHFDKVPESSIREIVVADMNKDAAGCVYSAVKKSTTQAPAKEKMVPKQDTNLTANGLLVEIVKGDIERQQVDAIVNCILSNGDLNGSGAASLRLSRAAGPELQQACRRLAPGSQLDPGRVLVTKGYGLPCQNVINVCCGNRYESVDPKVLSSHIAVCLRKGDELRAKTLAVPLLGADTLNISSTAIAQAIMSALSMYKAQTLKTVYCVADDDASFEVFRAQRREILGTVKTIKVETMDATPSLCLTVLGLSKKDVDEAVAKVAAELQERENSSKKGGDKI